METDAHESTALIDPACVDVDLFDDENIKSSV